MSVDLLKIRRTILIVKYEPPCDLAFVDSTQIHNITSVCDITTFFRDST